MVRKMLDNHIVVLLLLFGTSFAWSEKSSIPLSENADESTLTTSDTSLLEPAESKPRYKWRHGEGRYILEKDAGPDEVDPLQKDEEYDDDQQNQEYQNKKPATSPLESLKPKLKSPTYKGHTKEGPHIINKDNNGREIDEDIQKKIAFVPLDSSESKSPRFKKRYGKNREKEHLKSSPKMDEDYDDDEQADDKEIKKTGTVPFELSESKLKSSRYKGRRGEARYILNEDDHGHGGKDGEFLEEGGNEEQNEEEHDRGYHNEDKKLDDETSKDFSIKGTDQEFKEGGASFDKHHKDRASENKENEHVNEHDEGEKFGAEALKEHKLGKHREKSVGHKKHGFKNVYHKEEYGDHKTFHDEFLDNDHHHEYDDQHENRKLEGGRFSKGYLKEGENKELDAGDEKHAWGKGGHDSNHEGHYEEGGHITGHKQGHKKREGHHEASGHKHKHAKHKVKKGVVPEHHADDNHPDYYARTPKHEGKGRHSKVKENDGGDHHYGRDHDYYDDRDNQKGSLYPPVVRTHARLPETTEDLEEPVRHDFPEPASVMDRVRAAPKPLVPPEHHSFYYRTPQSEAFDKVPVRQEKPLPRAPLVPEVGHHNPEVVQSSKPNHHHHHNFGTFPSQLSDTGVHSGFSHHPQSQGNHPHNHRNNQHNHGNNHHNHGNNHHNLGNNHHNHGNNHHDHGNHPHRHFVVSQPSRENEPRDHLQTQPHPSMVSKPYPWWKHSRRQGDSAPASSHHKFGQERAPQQYNTWVPQNKFRYSEPYEHGASRQHNGFARVPEFYNGHHPY